jgi:hypothetical protein
MQFILSIALVFYIYFCFEQLENSDLRDKRPKIIKNYFINGYEFITKYYYIPYIYQDKNGEWINAPKAPLQYFMNNEEFTLIFSRDSDPFIGKDGKLKYVKHYSRDFRSYNQMLIFIKNLPPDKRNFYEMIKGDSLQKIKIDVDFDFEKIKQKCEKYKSDYEKLKKLIADVKNINSIENEKLLKDLNITRKEAPAYMKDLPNKIKFLEITEYETTKEYKIELIDTICDAIVDNFEIYYGIKLSPKNIIVFDSSSSSKFSFHIIIHGYHVENNIQAKTFCQLVKNFLFNEHEYEELKKTNKISKRQEEDFIYYKRIADTMDEAVYSSFQAFRIIHNCKRDKTNYKEFYESELYFPIEKFHDIYSFVGYVPPESVKLNNLEPFEKFKKEKKWKKSSSSKKNKKEYKERTFVMKENGEIEYAKISDEAFLEGVKLFNNQISIGYNTWRDTIGMIKNITSSEKSKEFCRIFSDKAGKGIYNEAATDEMYRTYSNNQTVGSWLFHIRNNIGDKLFWEYKKKYIKNVFIGGEEVPFHVVSDEENDYDMIKPTLNLKHENIIKIDSQFIGDNLPEKGNVLISGYCGSGKTRSIIDQLENIIRLDKQNGTSVYKNMRILILSPRIKFAINISSRFGFDCYIDSHSKNFDLIMKSNKLVISMESLWRVENREFDLLIIDECESNLNCFNSPTMGTHLQNNIDAFHEILTSAKRFIFADAFLTNRSIQLCNNLNLKSTLLIHSAERQLRKCIEIEMEKNKGEKKYNCDKFFQHIINLLKQNKKLFFVCSSKKRVRIFESWIKEFLPELRYRVYVGDGDDYKKDFMNPNVCWTNYDLIICTSCLTIGVDFDVKDYFDCIVLYASAHGCIIRDTFQSLMRVRHIKDNTLYYCVHPLPRYEEEWKRSTDGIINYINNRKDLWLDVGMLKNTKMRVYQSKWVEDIYIFNTLEESLGKMYYRDLFDYYLNFCGYEKQNPIESKVLLPEEVKVPNKITPPLNKSYSEIHDITFEQAKEIQAKKTRSDSTLMEKSLLNKYNFNEMFEKRIPRFLGAKDKAKAIQDVKEIDLCIEKLYDTCYVIEDRKTINFIYNAKYEKTTLDDAYIKDKLESGTERIAISRRVTNLRTINDILKNLKIKNSFTECEIKREKIEKFPLDKISRERMLDFGITFDKEPIQNLNENLRVKRTITDINLILSRWCGGKIKGKTQKRIQKKGIRQDVTDFEFIPQQELSKVFDYIKF